MIIRKWEDLPNEMQNSYVRYYYDVLAKKKFNLFIKRCFDIVVSAIMLILLSPVFLAIAIAIKMDSEGPVFYRQERITRYGEKYMIFKFRTMVVDADKYSKLTLSNDNRVTKIGSRIRKYRLDEICQLIDIFRGKMSFVGTRPEVEKYVAAYDEKMLATLLLPAGVTSEASIYYKDESKLLDNCDDVDRVYIQKVLPGKMYYNLREIENFSFFHDIKIMFMTVFAVLGKEYKGDYAPSAEGLTEVVSESESIIQ